LFSKKTSPFPRESGGGERKVDNYLGVPLKSFTITSERKMDSLSLRQWIGGVAGGDSNVQGKRL
jgi:hypothetical protein